MYIEDWDLVVVGYFFVNMMVFGSNILGALYKYFFWLEVWIVGFFLRLYIFWYIENRNKRIWLKSKRRFLVNILN